MAKNLAKIAVSREAEEALERMMKMVNEGFSGGRVSKAEMASWVLVNAEKKWIGSMIDAIRTDHFDQVQYLSHVVKELRAKRRSGADGQYVQELLAPIMGKTRKVGSRDQAGGLSDESCRVSPTAKASPS